MGDRKKAEREEWAEQSVVPMTYAMTEQAIPDRPERSEQEIFDRLRRICRTPGYIHALAYVAMRDLVTFYEGALLSEDLSHLFSYERVIPREVMTLIGLLMRRPINIGLPEPQQLLEMVSETDAALRELHGSILWEGTDDLREKLTRGEQLEGSELTAASFREPIFYGADDSYLSQCRDFAVEKYALDADWIRRNKGFDPAVGPLVIRCVDSILGERGASVAGEFRAGTPVGEWTPLTGFTFALSEVVERIGRETESVRALLDAFVAPGGGGNDAFSSLGDFNAAYERPLIRLGDDAFALLCPRALAQALYESPFFWMVQDDEHRDTAARHRGEYTERFCARRLGRVFGNRNVHPNVRIGPKGREKEIDVLVVFGDRALVVEAKSKRLTLASRQGNDAALKSDFKAAVEEAVGQVYATSGMLVQGEARLIAADGSRIDLREELQTVFPLTVLCDGYPALAAQCREFLEDRRHEGVERVLVTDAFQLDLMTEMLASPLRVLSYLEHRAQCGDALHVDHERTSLALHLKQNLRVPPDFDVVVVGDDACADLDVAMAVRRNGAAGSRTPEGILTQYEGTHYARIIAEIDSEPRRCAVGLGLQLLRMPEETVDTFNRLVGDALRQAAFDGRTHDVTMGVGAGQAGVTVHCTGKPLPSAETLLWEHCRLRKYGQKARNWFGLLLAPDASIRCVAELAGEWVHDSELQRKLDRLNGTERRAPRRRRKIGRNERCPCGSGKKYKHCCLR